MGLAFSLLIVFLLFCLMMAGVLAFCLRARGDSETIDHSSAYQTLSAGASTVASQPSSVSLHSAPSNPADEEQDLRVATIVFGSIFLGALLAVITGYLVFFRDWQ